MARLIAMGEQAGLRLTVVTSDTGWPRKRVRSLTHSRMRRARRSSYDFVPDFPHSTNVKLATDLLVRA
jgi:hypothetical protein